MIIQRKNWFLRPDEEDEILHVTMPLVDFISAFFYQLSSTILSFREDNLPKELHTLQWIVATFKVARLKFRKSLLLSARHFTPNSAKEKKKEKLEKEPIVTICSGYLED